MVDTSVDTIVAALRESLLENERLRQQLTAPGAAEPIAIVSMSCRYPGGVTTPEELWELVSQEKDAISSFPRDRGWAVDSLYDPVVGTPGKSYTRQGGFLYDAAEFDPEFFGISPREALAMDPQQRLLLETTWEAFERAGIDPTALRGTPTGVFAGVMYHDYGSWLTELPEGVEGYLGNGNRGSVASGRLAYVLGLEGPAVSVDTACSSSLVAIHLAVQALTNGECSLALAGGVTVMSTPQTFIEFSAQRGLSADGRCKSFAAGADGTGWGEGAGMLLLERLSDAQRNGHPVLAIVRGTAVNQDGASNGFTAPNGPSQQRVIEQALANAGLSPAEVDAVEAHGTGTTLGDPVEAGALLATYGQHHSDERPLWLGSVKSNIGHTQAAAGAAGVIKMVQAMQHGVLPSTLHVDAPSPHIDWNSGHVKLLSEPRDWPQPARPRRAGISSFGISGTNAHVILEQAPTSPSQATSPERVAPTSSAPIPWVLSAHSASALTEAATRLHAYIAEQDPRDVGYSLTNTRASFEHRAVVVGHDREELLSGVRALSQSQPHPQLITGTVRANEAVFVFPGQGSQWAGMATELLDTSPVFAAGMAECADALASHVDWDLFTVLREEPAMLNRVDVVQPSLWAIMVSLARLWRAHGVEPAAVIGHSQGEIAAACVAGALSIEDAAAVVALRGKLIARELAGQGGMLSIGLSAQSAATRIAGIVDVAIAALNGPNSVVVSGPRSALESLHAQLKAEEVPTKLLPVDYASHSAPVEKIRTQLLDALGGIAPEKGSVPMYSTMAGAFIESSELDGQYWFDNLRRPVQFAPSIEALINDGHRVFIEMSPHPVLSMGIEETADSLQLDDVATVGSLRRNEGGLARFFASVAQAFCFGIDVSWPEIFAEAHTVELPTYPFQRERYWLAHSRTSGDAAAAGLRSATHPLLGAHIDLPETGGLILTGRLPSDAAPWLADHKVGERVLLPGAAMVELALTAGSYLDCPHVSELTLEAPLLLPAEEDVAVQIWVGPASQTGERSISIHSQTESQWVRHASGTLAPYAQTQPFTPSTWPPPGATQLDAESIYPRLAESGYGYGPTFQGLTNIWQRGNDVFAEVALPDSERESAKDYQLHPALLDAVLHAALAVDNEYSVLLPFSWSGVQIHTAGVQQLRAHLRLTRGAQEFSFTLATPSGAIVASVDTLLSRPMASQHLTLPLHHVQWEPLPSHEPDEATFAVLNGQRLEELETPASHVIFPAGSASGTVPERAHLAVTEALRTAKTWLADDRFVNKTLVFITRDAFSESNSDPAAAAIWGLIRSAQTENPGRFVLLDIDSNGLPDGTIAAALHTGEEQLAIRGDRLFVPRLSKVNTASEALFDSSGTILLTGGTGELGSQVARHLVTTYGANDLLLTSRRGADAPGASTLATELAAHGARVRFASCDTADYSALGQVIDSVGDSLTTVIHLAGVLDDALITSMTTDQLDTVLRAKVDSAWNLHEHTKNLDLRAFILFSSAAGTLGTPGQGNYAAANAFLDSLAQLRRNVGLPAQSLAWGLWEQRSTMTTALSDADVARMARMGVGAMPTEQALGLLDAAMASGETTVTPIRLDTAAVRKSGEIPPILRSLVRVSTQKPATVASGNELIDRLMPLTNREREHLLLELLSDHIGAVLGHEQSTTINTKRAFKELGFDSLMAVELRNRLNAETGLRLPVTLTFDHPTPVALAQHLKKQLMSEKSEQVTATAQVSAVDEPIAIIGMGCRFPGGVTSPEQLWDLITENRDIISPFPTDRGWDIDAVYDPEPGKPGKSYTQHGGFLHDAADFDPDFFGISPREALAIDPQQRLLLETSWEAFERAGIDPTTLRGSLTGVFAGVMYHDYAARLNALPEDVAGFISLGNAGSVASGRISYTFGLEGPAMTVDTACSSSLVTLHLAAQALRAGECTLALAGGATVLSVPDVFVEFSRQRVLSPDGRCRTFAASADGTSWSEGAGMLLLERLSDAKRNGHHILALVKGSAVNQDGASNGLTAPNGPSQERVIRRALANAGLAPHEVDAVEAHGTGTRLGDPIEAAALLATYGQDRPTDKPLLLGSIKSNMGHTQAAAGVAGIIKMTLAMQRGVLPPTLHADEPSPHIDWSSGVLKLLTEQHAWPESSHPRRAGISSFGISGTNSHVILEQAPTPEPPTRKRADEPPLPWVLSAKSEAALRAQAGRLRAHLDETTWDERPVGYSLATTRAAFHHRAVLLGTDRAQLLEALDALAQGRAHPRLVRATTNADKTAFLFTGQGAQYPGMGRELYDAYPAFAQAFDTICAHMEPHLPDVREVMFDEGSTLLTQTHYTQAALFTLETALFRLLESWDILPDYLAGHSIGEIVAAHVGGVLSLPDACALVAARGRLMNSLPEGGAMLAVQASESHIESMLPLLGVSIAAVNSPTSVVISGDAKQLTQLAETLRKEGHKTTPLTVSHAFHSPLMDPILTEFHAAIAELTFNEPHTAIVSNLTGEVATSAQLRDPRYWVRHVRETVRFSDAINTLHRNEVRRFVELGPDGILSALTYQTVADPDIKAMPMMRADRRAADVGMEAVAALYAHGQEVNWAAMYGDTVSPIALPTYAFQRERYWLSEAAELPRGMLTQLASETPARPRQRITGVLDKAALLELVREEAASVLKRATSEDIEPHRAFKELGFSSLTALEFRNALSTVTGIELPATLVFDYPTPAALVEVLHSKLGDEGRTLPTVLTPTAALDTLERALSSETDDRTRHAVRERMRALVNSWDVPESVADANFDMENATADEMLAFIDQNLGHQP
ncbi:MAG: SDR family NAD(P)-dependent oxidoreductase [Corynebacteriales bacterium]|nr:SDR family NAD(P)-dependent oxidoreductase [Mycobacteriales bacterium]